MDKQRLQELAGIISESEIEYLKRMNMKIGDKQVIVNDVYRSSQMGNNPMADIEVDGKRYQAYKQGMINIWAFPGRDKFSREEQHELDAYLDRVFDEVQSEIGKQKVNETQTLHGTISTMTKESLKDIGKAIGGAFARLKDDYKDHEDGEEAAAKMVSDTADEYLRKHLKDHY